MPLLRDSLEELNGVSVEDERNDDLNVLKILRANGVVYSHLNTVRTSSSSLSPLSSLPFSLLLTSLL